MKIEKVKLSTASAVMSSQLDAVPAPPQPRTKTPTQSMHERPFAVPTYGKPMS